MAFNPFVFARLAEKYVERQNPLKTFINGCLYMVLTFVNLPYKMKLLDNRLKEYNKRLDQLEDIIDERSNPSKKVGSNFNVLR